MQDYEMNRNGSPIQSRDIMQLVLSSQNTINRRIFWAVISSCLPTSPTSDDFHMHGQYPHDHIIT